MYLLPSLRLLAVWVFSVFVLMGCSPPTLETDDPLLEKPVVGRGTEIPALNVPSSYHGPIDPQWPPSRSDDLAVELSANRLVLERLESSEWKKPEGAPLITVDTSGVRAEEGRIGGFDYMEVVLGHTDGPGEALPLVVLLHGRGGRPTIPESPYLSDQPLRLFIPRGPDPLKGGYNWLATWTNAGMDELLARSLAARADQLVIAIQAFRELRPTLGKPIVVGFSQGGILSFGLAVRHPKYFSAAFPIAGWLPPSLLPKRVDESIVYPYVHALNGGADTIVPTKKGRDSIRLLKQLGVRAEYTEVPGVGHAVTPEMNETVRLWVRNVARSFSVSDLHDAKLSL